MSLPVFSATFTRGLLIFDVTVTHVLDGLMKDTSCRLVIFQEGQEGIITSCSPNLFFLAPSDSWGRIFFLSPPFAVQIIGDLNKIGLKKIAGKGGKEAILRVYKVEKSILRFFCFMKVICSSLSSTPCLVKRRHVGFLN